jgi:hypothetical protein
VEEFSMQRSRCREIPLRFILACFLFFLCMAISRSLLGFTDSEVQRWQTLLMDKPIGERIAFWAEKFVGTPYDVDPLGEYVSKATVVADQRVDCMYLTFRAVELALSHTPEEAVQMALEKRFHSKGILQNGQVLNYEDRFEYGEDMIFSGKWGQDITGSMGRTFKIKGSRKYLSVEILLHETLLKKMESLRTGDIVFFIKRPEERRGMEIVGHIGIIKVEHNRIVYLIHASGTKAKGGGVKKVFLKEYVAQMPFIGVIITRFH